MGQHRGAQQGGRHLKEKVLTVPALVIAAGLGSVVTFGVRNEGSALQNLQNSSSGSSKGMAELLPALTIALPLQAQ